MLFKNTLSARDPPKGSIKAIYLSHWLCEIQTVTAVIPTPVIYATTTLARHEMDAIYEQNFNVRRVRSKADLRAGMQVSDDGERGGD